MTIKLTLCKSVIFESVKNETYFRGQVEKAVDQKAIAEAYHEQAGDERYQERILERGLRTNYSTLLTYLSDYLGDSGQSSADNIYTEENGDNIILSIVVSERFNRSYTDPLAKLCSKFVEDSMLVDWWRPVNEKQAAMYMQFVEKDLQDIRRCFNKTAPIAPSNPYTTLLTVTGSAIDMGVDEEHTVTYTISDGAIDDIEAKVEDNVICDIGRSDEGFTVIGKQLGHTWIQLYSRHNPELARTIHVYITDQT
jgi:hypothetical protein